MIAITGSKSTIEFRPLPGDDPRQRQPDIALAMERLGWGPAVKLNQGLGQTVAYFAKMFRPDRTVGLSV